MKSRMKKCKSREKKQKEDQSWKIVKTTEYCFLGNEKWSDLKGA